MGELNEEAPATPATKKSINKSLATTTSITAAGLSIVARTDDQPVPCVCSILQASPCDGFAPGMVA